jgi:cytochrome o ubiquinol oxidase subunit 2
MIKLIKALGISILIASVFGAIYFVSKDGNFAVLEPAGTIASQQKDLFIFTVILSMVIIIPVFGLLTFILLNYRETNKKSTYRPDWESNKYLEFTWWAFPIAIILVLAVVTWNTSHSLDPFKPIDTPRKPVTVEVIALEWKWLFIYPEYNIASVNYLNVPVSTPINFKISADAPMNSFWIPELGGQIYAMAGMQTKLHLLADEVGTFTGKSSNISGEGFSGMVFSVESSTVKDFDKWIQSVRSTENILTEEEYSELAEKSRDNPITLYSGVAGNLFNDVIASYNIPPVELREFQNGSLGGH